MFSGQQDVLNNISGILNSEQIKKMMPDAQFKFEWDATIFDSLKQVYEFVKNRGGDIFQLQIVKDRNQWYIFYSKRANNG